MATPDITEESLTSLYKYSEKAFHDIKNTSLESNSPEKQELIMRCISGYEQLTMLVSQASVFSTNETVDELPTSSLKFLSLPARLACLTQQRLRLKLDAVQNGAEAPAPGSEAWKAERKELLRISTVYYRDFLTRSRQYEITSYELPASDAPAALTAPRTGRPSPEQLKAMGQERDEKIRKLREKKAREERLLSGRRNVFDMDEEVQREFFMDVLANDVEESIEGLREIAMEQSMLERSPPAAGAVKTPPANPPLSTFLITRDAAQKAVYGLGYPSLPVMTVDEFYEKRLEEGWGPGAAAHAPPPPAPPTEDEREVAEEERSRESLVARDDYRDQHRTGWGNTYNRS